MDDYDWEKDAKDSWREAIAAKRAKLLMERIPAAKRVEVIGDCELILGDCLEVMPHLETVDAVVTDPPYGIGESGGARNRWRNGDGRRKDLPPKHELKSWDASRPPAKAFDYIANLSMAQIIWGGNYFSDLLPPSSGWLYWDKRIGGDFSDGELAYTSKQMGLRAFSVHPFYNLSGGKDRQHPTQKPVALMDWCLGFLPGIMYQAHQARDGAE